MEESPFYRVNGRFNPLSEEGYIIREDEECDYEATFYSPRNTLSDSGHSPYSSSLYLPPRIPHQDGAHVPLLNGIEGLTNVSSDGTDYCKEPVPPTNSTAWKKLLAATIICLLFMVVELVGGYMAGSLAVMTDAAHLLSDCVGFLVSLFAVWVAAQPPTVRFTFGYHRAEVLGALVSVCVVWAVTGLFVYLGITRLVKSDFEIRPDAMIIVALIGIAINIVMGSILHGGSVWHVPHGDEENINVRAAVIHVVGDLIQSIGVFISALIIKFFPDAKVIDPICTFVCCVLVVGSTVGVLRQSVWVLLEGVPPHLDLDHLQSALASLDGVQGVHSLHVWALTPGHYVATLHIAVGVVADRDVVLERAQRVLRTKYNLERVTIQVERDSAHLLSQ